MSSTTDLALVAILAGIGIYAVYKFSNNSLVRQSAEPVKQLITYVSPSAEQKSQAVTDAYNPKISDIDKRLIVLEKNNSGQTTSYKFDREETRNLTPYQTNMIKRGVPLSQVLDNQASVDKNVAFLRKHWYNVVAPFTIVPTIQYATAKSIYNKARGLFA